MASNFDKSACLGINDLKKEHAKHFQNNFKSTYFSWQLSVESNEIQTLAGNIYDLKT